MVSLSARLSPILVGIISPLYKSSTSLTKLTDSPSRQFAWELYSELKKGPQYQFSPEFSEFASKTEFTEATPKALEKLVNSVHNKLLRNTKAKVSNVQSAFKDWAKSLKETSPELFEFLYYLIASKSECENIKMTREEAQDLSEIFFTLSKHYPFHRLTFTMSQKDDNQVQVSIPDTHAVFSQLSHSFKEFADKQLTDPNAKLSLRNIIVIT